MSARALIAIPAGMVAAGAVIATAHGMHAVALAANVGDPIAWVYPGITDGLAVVAYATAHNVPKHSRYAWIVVVLSSLMSGLAQAAYLANGGVDAPPLLRGLIGFWPAVAGLLVGHLLYLLWQAWKAADVARRAEEAAARADEAAARVRALEEARAERERAEREREQERGDQPDARVVAMAKRRPQPAQPRRRASADDVDQDKAKELVESGKFGRKALARELDTTVAIARTLIARYGGTDTDAADDVDERESVNA